MSEKCPQSKSTSGEHYFVCHNHGLACHWCGQTKDIELPTPTQSPADQFFTEVLEAMKDGRLCIDTTKAFNSGTYYIEIQPKGDK